MSKLHFRQNGSALSDKQARKCYPSPTRIIFWIDLPNRIILQPLISSLLATLPHINLHTFQFLDVHES